MARHGKFTNPYIKIGGVDLSAHARSLTFNPSRASLQDAAFGDEFAKTRPGIKDYSISVEFYQDFAAGAVYATIYPLYNTPTDAIMMWKPVNSSVSATNPMFSGQVWVQEFPLGGSHGDNLMCNTTFGIRTDFTALTS